MAISTLNLGLQGALIGCAAIASRNVNRASNTLVSNAKAPLGALVAAYVLDSMNRGNVDVTSKFVRSVVPALTSGLTANISIREAESYRVKDGAFVLVAGALGQIFANKYVRPV